MVRKVRDTNGTKNPRMERKIHGTNRPWYEKSTNGMKCLRYEKSMVQKVWIPYYQACSFCNLLKSVMSAADIIRPLLIRWRRRTLTIDEIEVASSLNFSILVERSLLNVCKCVDFGDVGVFPIRRNLIRRKNCTPYLQLHF